MNNKTLRIALLAAAASTLGFGAEIARADVTITRTTSVDGVGGMALANMSGTSKTTISGSRSRTDSDMKMQSKFIGFLARNSLGPSTDIVLLDQDKIYHINLNKKEYTETNFEQMRAQLQKATDQMSANADKRQTPSAVDQSKCTWLPAKASVNKTGEKAQFAGFDAERAIVTVQQPCQDKDSGSICEVAVVLDQWVSPGFAENAEARKFYSAYAEKMGFDQAALQDATQRAKTLFSQYPGIWAELATKMQSLKGYPMKLSFTLGVGGAQCKDSNAQQAQSQSNQSSDDSSSSGGIAGAVAGKLGGLFHKKKDDSDAPAAAAAVPTTPAAPLPAGDVGLMTVSSQLVSMTTEGVGADAFVVPPDFKKVELKTE